MRNSTADVIAIPLPQNKITYIDNADADLAALTWGLKHAGRNRFYVMRDKLVGEFVPDEPWRRIHFNLHRVIMERIVGRPLVTSEYVDHIDGDTLNNRRSNLRIATNTQNVRNAKRPAHNKSGYKGVHWHKGAQKWRAMITYGGKHHHIGYFDDPKQAHEAYCAAAKHHYGEFARFE